MMTDMTSNASKERRTAVINRNHRQHQLSKEDGSLAKSLQQRSQVVWNDRWFLADEDFGKGSGECEKAIFIKKN